MDVSLEKRWDGFLEQVVKAGRYGSVSEVVHEGLRLVQEREARLEALRGTLDASIARGGQNTEEDVQRRLAATGEELRRAGY